MNEDTLFLACTRPAMFAGVTMEAMALNVMATTTLFILTSSFSMMGLGFGMHFVLREVTKYDHNQFRVLFAWLNTRGKQKNLSRWGGGSTSPLRLIRTYKELMQ
ncbi:type IV secretion system protein VirB3 [Bartonella vinsonii]|uniref:Type IV secretion system protein VirB3 n=1 Tax=Bartonella vinsonii subsp. berkhoffii str. Tweed TaxID=1094502 RepID=N6UQD2_BARVB|nr:type IV secretion system protein VirB3 [Bartonella vinsonii]ENN94539.1 type IV secretion system protein VirB3 [Bartonella vinsonii subsp. berkhoffii str. Tweed]